MVISEFTSTFDLWVYYIYNLMTQLYFRHEIAIGFKNVMLRIKIISNINFSCEVTIHEF